MPRRLVLLVTLALAGAGAAAACGERTVSGRIASAGAGDLRLASGQALRLADIRLLDGGAPGRPDGAAWLASLANREVLVAAAGAVDRWERLPARVTLQTDGIDVAELLVAEGLAAVDVGEADALCRPDLLALEGLARAARRGAWAAWPPLPANDPDAIAARAGGFAVVEGRIVSVGERSRWTYLNFGRDVSRDFAVSIPRRRWDAMKRAGLSADVLRGRMVRVRGLVEMRRAPGIELVAADMLEWRSAETPRP